MSLEDIQPNRNKEDYKRMKEQPDSQAGNDIIDVLGSIDADFGYAVGNLNMDTTPESRQEIISKLKAYADRLATERAISELQDALTLWSAGETKQHMLDRITALTPTLPKEADNER